MPVSRPQPDNTKSSVSVSAVRMMTTKIMMIMLIGLPLIVTVCDGQIVNATVHQAAHPNARLSFIDLEYGLSSEIW